MLIVIPNLISYFFIKKNIRKAGGAFFNVSFGFSVVAGESGSMRSCSEKKGSEIPNGDRHNSFRIAGRVLGPSHVVTR